MLSSACSSSARGCRYSLTTQQSCRGYDRSVPRSTCNRAMKPVQASLQGMPRPKSSAPPGPRMVMADEPTRALLHTQLGRQLHEESQLVIMRGPHGSPFVPLDDPKGEILGLLGSDSGQRQGIVRRIALTDGDSITLRPNLRGPVHPNVIATARSNYRERTALRPK